MSCHRRGDCSEKKNEVHNQNIIILSVYLCGGRIHQIHPGVSLPQHMVTPWRVSENFHAIKSHFNMRTVKAKGRKKNQLAILCCEYCSYYLKPMTNKNIYAIVSFLHVLAPTRIGLSKTSVCLHCLTLLSKTRSGCRGQKGFCSFCFKCIAFYFTCVSKKERIRQSWSERAT